VKTTSKKRSVPNIRNAYSALTVRGAASLKTDIMSKKSSNVQSPSLLELKTLQILSLNGLTLSSVQVMIFAMGSLAFRLCPTFSGASALNFWWALMKIVVNISGFILEKKAHFKTSFLVK